MQVVRRNVCLAARQAASSARGVHSSATRLAISKLAMPAMSPTMTEGGISSWKKKEGESFSAGDILLEVETDKATIDVEAQDDGILGKIILQNGEKNIPVGKTIALLAEEGDDISNIEIPKDEDPAPPPSSPSASSSSSSTTTTTTTSAPAPSTSSPQPPTSPPSSRSDAHIHPTHTRPLFPSVLRLLQENGIGDAAEIKGTGVRGMLTKGDVLAHLGKASSPTGSFVVSSNSPIPKDVQKAGAGKKVAPPPVLDGPAMRKLIVDSMLKASQKARSATAPLPVADFDSIIADYIPITKTPTSTAAPLGAVPLPSAAAPKPSKPAGYLDGLY